MSKTRPGRRDRWRFSELRHGRGVAVYSPRLHYWRVWGNSLAYRDGKSADAHLPGDTPRSELAEAIDELAAEGGE
ncbi:MAG: hypothetical protein AAF589_02960 [Planctomycetota bacterium]